MDKGQFIAVRLDGTIPQKYELMRTFRGDSVVFLNVTHPRKVTVSHDLDNPDSPANTSTYYASVLNLGIYDNWLRDWTFSLDSDKCYNPLGRAVIGESEVVWDNSHLPQQTS